MPIDAVLIEQVLINLLENADEVHAGRQPDRDLGARATTARSSVEVADRGPGVPPETSSAIFEKFYRLPREGAGGGAGLGLAICRGIVEAHGGRIWVGEPRRRRRGVPLHAAASTARRRELAPEEDGR